MNTTDILNKLYAFKTVDKYEAFQEIQPSILFTNEAYKATIASLLDNCCKELIHFFEVKKKKPAKLLLKQSITKCMDEIAKADLNTENRDFGYELCWFLAEKVGLSLKGSSQNKIWGYWEINENEVIPIQPKKRRGSKS